MLFSAILFAVVIGVIAYILQAWFQRNPRPWAKYAYIALAVLLILSVFWSWRAYH